MTKSRSRVNAANAEADRHVQPAPSDSPPATQADPAKAEAEAGGLTIPDARDADGPVSDSPAREPLKYADPRPEISVSLGDSNGGPSMHLLRSRKYRQMQIRFDRGQPDEAHLARLREAGWTDRTESEGIWTKQVPPGEWRPVVEAERLFAAIADDIRASRGLAPIHLAGEPGRG